MASAEKVRINACGRASTAAIGVSNVTRSGVPLIGAVDAKRAGPRSPCVKIAQAIVEMTRDSVGALIVAPPISTQIPLSTLRM